MSSPRIAGTGLDAAPHGRQCVDPLLTAHAIMNLLITGATGFVMSVLARHWLEAEPHARLVILDAAAADAAAVRYFAPVADRLRSSLPTSPSRKPGVRHSRHTTSRTSFTAPP